jgi:hypothetical protein
MTMTLSVRTVQPGSPYSVFQVGAETSYGAGVHDDCGTAVLWASFAFLLAGVCFFQPA